MEKYTYLIIDFVSVLFPFLLSFDKKVAFYKTWNRLFPAIFIVGVFFVVWDIAFTNLQVWSFNAKYIVGIKFFNLPIEEYLFFLCVPYSCVFIYDCYNAYFPQINPIKKEPFTEWFKGTIWRKNNGTLECVLCPVCSLNTISIGSFHAGHILPESKGGMMCLENIMPICGDCNSQMGARHLYWFSWHYYGKVMWPVY
jgi:lycopene cyclase domain-containing protein